MEGKGLHEIKFPVLCVANGDVYIKLSDLAHDAIILPSAVLKDSLYFQRIMKGEGPWAEDRQGKQSRTDINASELGEKITIHKFALHYPNSNYSNANTQMTIVAGPTDLDETSEEQVDAEVAAARAAQELERKSLAARAFLLEADVSDWKMARYKMLTWTKSNPSERCARYDETTCIPAYQCYDDEHSIRFSRYGLRADHERHVYCKMPCDESVRRFHHTEYFDAFPTPAPGTIEDRFIAHEHAIIAHKVLFTFLMGKSIDVHDMDHNSVIHCAVDVAALAQTYDLLPLVAEQISAFMRRPPRFWRSLDYFGDRTFFLSLAVKLRDTELYFEAIRHVAASSCLHCHDYNTIFRKIESVFEEEYPEWDVRDTILQYRHQIAKKSTQVLNAVRAELLTSRYFPNFGEAGALFLGTAAPRSSRQAATFLAKSLISEWLTNKLLGLHICDSACPTCASIKSF